MAGRSKKATTRGLKVLHKKVTRKGKLRHLVGVGNLRVIITKDDGSWFAQALEIDYAAEGISLSDVKRRFEQGLEATIDEHLKRHGRLEQLFQPAPRDIWNEWYLMLGAAKYRFSQVTVHDQAAPWFRGITYFEPKAA
jgi:hypothetical protein